MTNHISVGVCIGASTISAVKITTHPDGRVEINQTIKELHEGKPHAVLHSVLKRIDAGQHKMIVTGRKLRHSVNVPTVTESEATEFALQYLDARQPKQRDTVISAGGETFMVYQLDKHQRISGISTGNKCASGTGEFFLQQIRRMNLTIDEAIAHANSGDPYLVSGRCSVFCKSDCTHALNKGVKIADVTSGLCRMIAGKIAEIANKSNSGQCVLVGGVAQNSAVTKFLKEMMPQIDIPAEAPYFEALGAAIAARHTGVIVGQVELLIDEISAFSFLPALSEAEDLVSFRTLQRGVLLAGDDCVIGLDVGSTTTKAVLLRRSDRSLLDSVYLRTNGNPVEAARACFVKLLAGIGATPLTISGIGTTGSGRHIAGLYSLTVGVINEIIAHANAAVFFDPTVDTIFEIGGQDAKYTHITNGVASDYAMNEACSAGTGSFLEEAALESLGVPTLDIAAMALKAKRPPNFNDQCAAFVSSDIKNAMQEGISREDITAGLVYSVCFNYNNRVKGNRTIGNTIFMQGGVCYNRAVPLAMANILKKKIVVPPEPGLMGAFGVALEVDKRLALGVLETGNYNLGDIIGRQVNYEEPFVCNGGKEKCDLKCSINRIRIDGRLFPFGGACDRYYHVHSGDREAKNAVDYVRLRNELLFGEFAPVRAQRPEAPVIGFNRSFLTWRLFPLYYNFFSILGSRVVMPDSDDLNMAAVNRQITSMCYPAEISLAYFDRLLALKPDYLFLPYTKELYVPGGIDRVDFCSVCAFSAGEGFWVRQAFGDSALARDRMLTPLVNFNGGWENGRQAFVDTAVGIGFDAKAADAAFSQAIAQQIAFDEKIRSIGRQVLDQVHADPSAIAIVLFGRSYNAYVPEINKGIPRKIASRNVTIIPYDMIDFLSEPLGADYADYMHWQDGQKILRAAQLVERDPQLFGVFITNFLCAPDSFLVSYFRSVMGGKPSLTLELDAHTADAGVNTRIEAFLDIVGNYQKIQLQAVPQQRLNPAIDLAFRPAVTLQEQGSMVYIDSSGERLKLTDQRVKFLIPPMGNFGSRGIAAVCRKLGIRAEALPRSDAEVLRLGRGATTCKECMPMIILLGALLRYLKYRNPAESGERVMIFVPKAAGYCRLGQYHVAFNQYIRQHQLSNVATINLGLEEQYAGLGTGFAINGWKSMVITDILDDTELALRALASNPPEAQASFERESSRIEAALDGTSGVPLGRQLKRSARVLSAIPLKSNYADAPKIAFNGEFFVRRDPFSNLGIAYRLADQGFVVRMTAMSDWIYYTNYLIKEGMVEPHFTFATWLEFVVSDKVQHFLEKRIKRQLGNTGLYEDENVDIRQVIGHAELVLPKHFPGEPGLTAGLTLMEGLQRYAGVINVGPFGCMQTRMGDAVVMPQATAGGVKASYAAMGKPVPELAGFADDDRIPYLSIESDGNPYPQLLEARFESFCLQARRAAERMGKGKHH